MRAIRFFMSDISLLLRNVYENEYVFSTKLNYSEPKIYTGGVDASKWSKLSREERREALQKDWYVYYSFRDPGTGKLKRQSQIKGGANRFKTKTKRLKFLRTLQRNLLVLLEAGFDPYRDNSELEAKFRAGMAGDETGTTAERPGKKATTNQAPTPTATEPLEKGTGTFPDATDKNIDENRPRVHKEEAENRTSVQEAFELGLKIKKSVLNANSFTKYKSRINRFLKWLGEHEPERMEDITKVDRSTVIRYLNWVLDRTSAANRNNARGALSSFFTTLRDNDIIAENFILSINKLSSRPERHKTFSQKMEDDIDNYLAENDQLLRQFIWFVSYNLLRPIEVCRLKVGDLDLDEKRINYDAKDKLRKRRRLQEIMVEKLPDLSELDKDDHLFTPYGLGGKWDIPDADKRNYFSKRFKKVKDHFGLGKDYGLYSYRHTYITKLYRKLRKKYPQQLAKAKLKQYTEHTTQTALEKYLRNIDAEMPEDYSEYFRE